MSNSSHFNKFLAIDLETSGMSFQNDDPSNNYEYQIVSIGLIVSNTKTYSEDAVLYREIRWNGTSQWNAKAESIHGLTKEYLEESGMDEEDALADIVEFILEHFDSTQPIVLMGHNVVSFDKPFFKALLRKHGIMFKFSHRALDSFPVGLLIVDAYDSNELFDKMGFPPRKEHNALEDIRYTLKAFRGVKNIMDEILDGNE